LLAAWGARWLAPMLPFSAELALAAQFTDAPQSPEDAARSAALQALADRLAARMDLPDDMRISVRHDGSEQVNAYASVGGRVVVFGGLLRRLDSEDALAALLAHEIAHVKHRHVAANVGRGLALAMVLTLVSADAGAAAAQSTLGHAAGLVLLGYSRDQESEADEEALRAVHALYGHVQGVDALFAQLESAGGGSGPAIEVLQSHPLTATRRAALEAHARRNGWSLQGTLTPLPQALVLPARR
jgi:beta-barrel assembly-enhancing protease